MKHRDFSGTIVFGLCALIVFVVGQSLMQNVHISTTNGLWKSFTLRDYMGDPGWARIAPSNALLFPLHALFANLYDSLSLFEGVRWRQMALTNAIFGALGAGVCYYFAYIWTTHRVWALLIAAVYCFSGFFLLHGLINEDIMPSFVFALLAMLLAGQWFGAPKYWQVMVVSGVFCISWLIEWRVMFPALPPLCLALLASQGTYLQRVLRVVVFLAVVVLAPLLFSALSWLDGYRNANQVLDYAQHLLWTGKGVGSGWSGFSIDKIWVLGAGISESIYGARYLNNPNWFFSPDKWSTLIGLALVGLMATLGLRYVWRHRQDASVRAKFILFYGLFVAGAVFNAYSQPSDPQMQINIMLVALPGWTLIIAGLMMVTVRDTSQISRILIYSVVAVLVCAPIAFSTRNLMPEAGKDAREIAYRTEIEEQLDITSTVFLYHDFDGKITWWVAKYDGRSPEPLSLAAAPSMDPGFKWIGYVRNTIENPDWDGVTHAEYVTTQINHVMELGYTVVVPDYWNNDEDYWELSFASVASGDKARDIRATLHSKFTTTQTATSSYGDTFLELHRR